jgi:hypothetical protein
MKKKTTAVFSAMAVLIVVAFFAGCGGGSSVTATPPTPNPIVKQLFAVKVTAHNDITGVNTAVTNANVTVTAGTTTLTSQTSATGTAFFSLFEGEYAVGAVNSGTVNQRFAIKNQNFLLTSTTKIMDMTVTPLEIVTGEVVNQSDTNQKVSGADVALSGPNFATQTVTTVADGKFTFTDIPVGTGYRLSISNIGQTTPRIGKDIYTDIGDGALSWYSPETAFSVSGNINAITYGVKAECFSNNDPLKECSLTDPGDATFFCSNAEIGGTDPDGFGPINGADPSACGYIANRHN